MVRHGKGVVEARRRSHYTIPSEVTQMEKLESLISARREAERKIRAALDNGHMDEVLRLAAAAREYDNALCLLRNAAQRIVGTTEADDAVDHPVEARVPADQASAPNMLSKNARGKLRRAEYIRKLEANGIRLSHTKGRIYETASGRRVGIAYASEVIPQKWWMGLLDERYDVVVLLCESRSGKVIDFVLPPGLVHKAWPLLSRNGKQREIHVLQAGVNYELEPGKGLGKINEYRWNVKELN